MRLLPTPGLRQAAFERRGAADALWLRTSDPDQALAHLLKRDRIARDELVGENACTGMRLVHIDGTRTVEDVAGQLAADFGPFR